MLTALLSAFLGGVILNFMPCVFPILSLKALALLRHGGSPKSARLDALAFATGALASFLVLGGAIATLRSAGVAVGWGFQLQSPLVTGALALVMLGAALNLLGLFEVGTSMQGVGQGLTAKAGWVGALFTGILAVVVASPCIAPFMAGALSYALLQPIAQNMLVFLALGIGFAAPVLALAFVPGLAARLPRPGAWMIKLKRVLALPMFAAAAWLAWVAGQQAGAGGQIILLVAAAIVTIAAAIYGVAQKRQVAGEAPFRLQFAALAGLSTVLPLLLVIGNPTQVRADRDAVPSVASAEPVTWSPDKVAQFRAHGRPIFVNFTASWCVTCQVNDKAALSTAEVKAAMARTGAVYMVADSTKFDAQIEGAMAGFGSGGLPLYVVYPADGGAPRILPQVLTKALVVEALDKAQKRKT